MISVRAAAVATQIIGVIWALLAVLYTPDNKTLPHDFGIGIGVALTGIAIWITASWWESR
jgi:hypothetical protein